MSFENILLGVEETIAVITVNRPKALNALNRKTLEELEAAVHEVGRNSSLRALIITGAGEKSFVAGADIVEMSALQPVEARRFSELGYRVGTAIERLEIPVIAAVNGFALGGGCELAMACDFIIASTNASFGQPEVSLGVIPGFGGCVRLPKLVGTAWAKYLVYSGERISAGKAREIGLVLEVVEPAELMPRARAIAASIAKRGPLAVAQAKRVMDLSPDMDLASAARLEQQAFGLCFGTEDAREGLNAFAAKREAQFKNR
ncbi:MAG: Crotonyl-CoA hydratase [Myxococcota bacterium]|nr:Crotonyl-CoA hydratase [Myxococcota bacterium]